MENENNPVLCRVMINKSVKNVKNLAVLGSCGRSPVSVSSLSLCLGLGGIFSSPGCGGI